jgi:hypothetical protein
MLNTLKLDKELSNEHIIYGNPLKERKIYLYDGEVIKYDPDIKLASNWICKYNLITKHDKRFVKVHDYKYPYLSMELINEPFVSFEMLFHKDQKHPREKRLYAFKQYLDIHNFLISFSDKFSFNTVDFKLKNLIFTESNRVFVLDPDSFSFMSNDSPYHELFRRNHVDAYNKMYRMLFWDIT